MIDFCTYYLITETNFQNFKIVEEFKPGNDNSSAIIEELDTGFSVN